MPERGTRRYTLEGPCASWALQGRDGGWYRVCVPCDTVIPQGGRLPRHLANGYRRQADAEVSVRAHVRDMERNRVRLRLGRLRESRIIDAARRGDLLAYGREITRDPQWVIDGPHCPPEDVMRRSMAEWLASREGSATRQRP